MTNCLDIVRPFAAEAAAAGYDNFQIFGGIGSHALTLQTTEIHPEDRLVTVSEEVMLAQYRADGNLRDLDSLVLSTDDSMVSAIESLAKEVIGEKQLILSFFGLRPLQQLEKQRRHPAWGTAVGWLSDRYVETIGADVVEAKKALYPFAVDLEPTILETWQLVINDDDPLPIPHPGVTILNYLTRSISGLRPKDAAKVDKLVGVVAEKAPEVIEWVIDGPGRSQIELARILHSLGGTAMPPEPLVIAGRIKIAPYDLVELRHHEAFMPGAHSAHAASALKAAQLKNKVVRLYEKSEVAVTWWQKNVEPRIGSILKNKW